LVGIEFFRRERADLLASNQAQDADDELKVEDDVDKGYFGCGGQGVVDDGHESHVDDHECGDVADFIIEIRALYEGEECEDGDEDQRDEDSECVHDGVLVEGNREGDHFEGPVLAWNIFFLRSSKSFLAIDIEPSFRKIVLSQAAIIGEEKLFVDASFLLWSIVADSLHAVEFELDVFQIRCTIFDFIELDIDVFEDEGQFEVKKVEGGNEILLEGSGG
jgi:hypothetical protein